MPKNVTTLGLLIICVSLCSAGSYFFEAPVIVTKLFALTGAVLTAIEKLGAK